MKLVDVALVIPMTMFDVLSFSRLTLEYSQIRLTGARGNMVEAVGYKPEGRGLYSPIRPLNFLLYANISSCSLGLGVDCLWQI
jgi:ABC-type uncharacterized transport system ATPase subunit